MSHCEKEKNQEEAKEVDEGTGQPQSNELCDEDLKEVAGGAFPTAVNDQITD